MKKFIPLGSKVLIKPNKTNDLEKTKGGIYIPSTVNKQTNNVIGIVAAIGEDFISSIELDDTVVYDPTGAIPITVANTDYLIVDYDNIIGITYDVE